LRHLYDAVRAPRFLPYLGRRSCPPSHPLDLGEPLPDTDLRTALGAAPWQASAWYRRRTRSVTALDLLIDCPPADVPHLSLRDTPVSFDPRHRQYALRGVVTSHVDVPVSHDPTTNLRPLPAPRTP
ncbi:type I-E CRISPR-associated protein Cas5/CasD, partial [Streptomyces niveiscabiei]|uniref:type I-E CRISPR-associated protein Cas5/CasD n=1 Tax=Streptomyces niveiscabiei TaxID=164115 RepID=UPI0029AA5261